MIAKIGNEIIPGKIIVFQYLEKDFNPGK